MSITLEKNDHFFDLTGPAGTVRITISGPLIRIARKKKIINIKEEDLVRIAYHPGSWRFGSSRPVVRIRFLYLENGRPKKTEVALADDDPGIRDFLHFLDRRYPAQSCLGPNEREKDRILSKDWRSTYGLHALSVLTPVGIFLGAFLVSILILSIILAEPGQVQRLSAGILKRTLLVFLGLALIPASLIALIAAKKLMSLRTDFEGLTIRRIFSRSFIWREVEIGEPRSDCFNVYTGIACYYADHITVVASRGLIEVPLLQGGKEVFPLRLNLEEAGPLFRELYYRGKVSLETARKIGAFI